MSLAEMASVMAASAVMAVLGDLSIDTIKVLGDKASKHLIPTIGKLGSSLQVSLFGEKKSAFKRVIGPIKNHIMSWLGFRKPDEKVEAPSGLIPWIKHKLTNYEFPSVHKLFASQPPPERQKINKDPYEEVKIQYMEPIVTKQLLGITPEKYKSDLKHLKVQTEYFDKQHPSIFSKLLAPVATVKNFLSKRTYDAYDAAQPEIKKKIRDKLAESEAFRIKMLNKKKEKVMQQYQKLKPLNYNLFDE